MALYEYQCDACSHRFERIQRFSDPPPESCPKCGSAVRKLLSSPAFQFKGSGWYVTDYARKSDASKRSEGESKDSAGKDASATETKPAAKESGTKESSPKESSTKDTGSKESKEKAATPAPKST
jgi:putative FmdB family regulatory protein